VITAILVVGIKESARFNATIVTIKVAVVLFVIGLGVHYINFDNWGHDWSNFAPWFCWHRSWSRLHIFRLYGFDAVSTTAQECKNPQRDLPIASWRHSSFAHPVYPRGGCADRHGSPGKNINIEAPLL